MQVQIKRVDSSLPLPEYHTGGSAGFDLYSREDAVIPAKSLALLPSNLIICTPPGYALILAARSSLAKKKGLQMPNGVGVIDSDYCGPEDEIKLSLYNFTDSEVRVEKGERLVQGMFFKVEQGQWEEVKNLDNPSRGGFGSTDK
jgi:dUTP pyrophosphatase